MLLKSVILCSTILTTSAFISSSSSSVKATQPSLFFQLRNSASSIEAAEAPTDEKNKLLLSKEYNDALQYSLSKIRESPIPKQMDGPLAHFLNEYFIACSQNPIMTPEEAGRRYLEAVKMTAKYGLGQDSFKFKSSHVAFRGGEEDNPEGDYDFYKFGCEFMYACINKEKSVFLGMDAVKDAFEKVKKGENVVFLANHQTEADPQVVSYMLSEFLDYEEEAASIVYVAGHKVTTDPLAIPFSMGRNLLCIHSKKHINAEPELKSKKTEQNLQTMAAMTKMLKKGGTALWVAPSGGRDRRDVDSNYVPIAPFDQKTVDMFRLLGRKSKVPTHFYSMAMVTYDMCPPPDTTVSNVGEERNIRYVPVGLAISGEIPNIGGVESRHLFTEKAEEMCRDDYELLLSKL